MNWVDATEEQKYAAMRRCETMGGSFAHYIAKAWFHADGWNRQALDKSFADLFAKYLT